MSLKKTNIIFIFVIFSCVLTGCLGIESKDNTESLISINDLNKIIKENVEPISMKPNFGGKVFCTYKTIGSKKDNDVITIYLNLLAQEYCYKNNKLSKGTGEELPVVLTVKKENDNYKFLKCDISRQVEEIEANKIFPKSIRKKASKTTFTLVDTEKLKKEAEKYFNINQN